MSAPSAEMEVALRLIARSEEARKRGTFHYSEEPYVPLARAYIKTCEALEECLDAMKADNPADGWLEIIQRGERALSCSAPPEDKQGAAIVS